MKPVRYGLTRMEPVLTGWCLITVDGAAFYVLYSLLVPVLWSHEPNEAGFQPVVAGLAGLSLFELFAAG